MTYHIEQEEMANQVIVKNVLSNDIPYDINDRMLIGGIDIRFSRNDPNMACVGLAVCDMRGKNIYKKFILAHMDPYVTGYIGYREVPHYLNVLQNIPKTYMPDILLVNGHGQLHHKNCGSASHTGVLADIPTIGVAKSYYSVEEDSIRTRFREYFTAPGTAMPIMNDGLVIGAAVNLGARNPVYVSIGHRIELDTAVDLVIHLTHFMTPEPLRQADQITREALRDDNKGRTSCI